MNFKKKHCITPNVNLKRFLINIENVSGTSVKASASGNSEN